MEDLDNLINGRIIERQRKLDFIAGKKIEMQNAHNAKRRNYYITISSIAAIAIIAFIISPYIFDSTSISQLDIASPQFEDFRGVSDIKIEAALTEGNYELALSSVDSVLKEIKEELYMLEKSQETSDEAEYNLQLTKDYYSELLWTKIYFMVKLNNQSGLKNIVDEYLNVQANQPHASDAEKILSNL